MLPHTRLPHLCADVAFASPDFQVNVQYADGTSSTSYNLYGLDTIDAPCLWNQVRQMQGTQGGQIEAGIIVHLFEPSTAFLCCCAACLVLAAARLSCETASVTTDGALQLDTGTNTTAVCVIDSGVQTNHPDLAANLWRNPFEIPGNGIDDDGNGEPCCAGVCCSPLNLLACWRPIASALLERSARSFAK